MSNKFRINDKVIIICGKDKGKRGIIKKIFVKKKKVIVNGINLVYKNKKSNLGGIVKIESCIDISNISHFCYNSFKKLKLGFKYKNGKKFRFFKIKKL